MSPMSLPLRLRVRSGAKTVREQPWSSLVSRGADTKANTGGGGALELGDSRLFEDGSEHGGAPVSDVVVADTAGEGRSEDG